MLQLQINVLLQKNYHLLTHIFACKDLAHLQKKGATGSHRWRHIKTLKERQDDRVDTSVEPEEVTTAAEQRV